MCRRPEATPCTRKVSTPRKLLGFQELETVTPIAPYTCSWPGHTCGCCPSSFGQESQKHRNIHFHTTALQLCVPAFKGTDKAASQNLAHCSEQHPVVSSGVGQRVSKGHSEHCFHCSSFPVSSQDTVWGFLGPRSSTLNCDLGK